MDLRGATFCVTVVFTVVIVILVIIAILRQYCWFRSAGPYIAVTLFVFILLILGWWFFFQRVFFIAVKKNCGDSKVTPEMYPNDDECSSNWVQLRGTGLDTGDSMKNCLTGGSRDFFVDTVADQVIYKGLCSRTFVVNVSLAATTTINERRIEIQTGRIYKDHCSLAERVPESAITISNVFTTSNPCQTSGTAFMLRLEPGDRVGFYARLAPGNDEGGVSLILRTLNISFMEV
jgi:hypothetical protein